MLQKKPSPSLVPARKQLELLYARRKTVEILIDSLERYDRMRVKALEFRKRQTA